MSLTYLSNNIFRFQEVDENSVIYKSTNSSFATIQASQGVLMCNVNNTLSFGIPTAAELVENYTGNSIVMTSANKLVEVPVTGSSLNKLLRLVDGAWQVVDFSVEYIKPELYDPSSWQLWIADDEINVINIPKEDISNKYYGVKFNNITETFDVVKPETYQGFTNTEIYIQYKNNDFKNVYENAVIYSNVSSDNSNLFSCLYSSNVSDIFDNKISNYIDNVLISENIYTNQIGLFCIYGGLYIENYNEHTSNASIVSIITDGINSYTNTRDNPLLNINQCIKNTDNSVIIPCEIVCLNHYLKGSFTNHPSIYIMVQKSSEEDNSIFHWYYPRNYLNMYIQQ